jgi:succinate-acetate transporter protein
MKYRRPEIVDLIFLALTILFFLLSIAYVRGCEKVQQGKTGNEPESIVGLIVFALPIAARW